MYKVVESKCLLIKNVTHGSYVYVGVLSSVSLQCARIIKLAGPLCLIFL